MHQFFSPTTFFISQLGSYIAIQYLLHKWGDFMFQTSWMALTKIQPTKTGWIAAITHGCIYSIPFLLLANALNLTYIEVRIAIICVSHILIDHYRLAGLWARLVNWEWGKPQPVIPTWCMTEMDQIMHYTINTLVLSF